MTTAAPERAGSRAPQRKKCGRIVYNLHPFLPHVKTSNSSLGPKRFLKTRKSLNICRRSPSSENDRVNHVLEQPWACKGAVLGYMMTHQDQRCVRRPAGFEQARGHGPDLVDIAGHEPSAAMLVRVCTESTITRVGLVS